jgi:phosphatidylinositol glycan class B
MAAEQLPVTLPSYHPGEAGACVRTAEHEDRAAARPYLWGILALALALRVAVIVAGPYIIHADELFQYYEQAHRLAFGSGVVPWEFHDGARSWLVPGILAAIMKVSRQVGSDPIYYIDGIRILCAILSLTVVYVGFELARRRDGRFGAVLTGTLCAIWIDPIFFAPSIMGEVLSAYCFLVAFLVAETATGRETSRQMALVGMLLGLAVCFRVQMGPALFVFAVLRCRAEWRQRWLPLLVGGGVVVALDLGLLDLLTWGSPFHSVWHYLLRGLFQKFGGGYSTPGGSLYTYARLILGAWTPRALPFVFILIVGAFRVPILASILAALVATYAVFANVEYRYLCCVLLACPILMGMGATYFCDVVRRVSEARGLRGEATKVTAGAVILIYAVLVSYVAAASGPLFQTLDRNVLKAFLLAHRQPQLCGLGALGVGWAEGWSYTYLDRDAPLYGGSFSTLKVINPAGISVPQSIVLHGKSLPTYSDDELEHNPQLYNFLVAPPDYRVAGFSPVECFDSDVPLANPKVCLFKRSGGCELPSEPSQDGR